MRSGRAAKVIMLGDSSVGKTSIILQFYKQQFEETGEPTIGASYITKVLPTSHGDISLHIWDTAGQERFKSVIPMYMRGCSAAILVCSVDNPDSVKNLADWLKLVKDHVDNLEHLYVVLNKIDLSQSFEAGAVKTWAEDNDCTFFKTSARHRDTIEPLFQSIAEAIAATSNRLAVEPQPVPQNNGSGGSCC